VRIGGFWLSLLRLQLVRTDKWQTVVKLVANLMRWAAASAAVSRADADRPLQMIPAPPTPSAEQHPQQHLVSKEQHTRPTHAHPTHPPIHPSPPTPPAQPTVAPKRCVFCANVSRMRRALSPIHSPDISFSISILPGGGWVGVGWGGVVSCDGGGLVIGGAL